MAALFSVYVGLNLILINFAPILHHFSFQVIVVDAATGEPVSEANVGWHRPDSDSGNQWMDEIGKTDEDGRLMFEETIQEQPLWLWPMVGEFQFGSTFHVVATEYEEQLVPLETAMPGVPYSGPEGLVRVALVRGVRRPEERR